MKKALIFDLDNTIYPVHAIADHLFEQLFALLDEHAGSLHYDIMLAAKDELKRRPYQLVAHKYNFSEELTSKGLELLQNITYDLPMDAFPEYHDIKTVPLKKFLVTTGFTKLQWSKVDQLGIKADFEEIHIVDPQLSAKTKRDVFADISARYHYTTEEVLVIGDDPESEIRAAHELGIDTFLFDPDDKHADAEVTHRSNSLLGVLRHLS
jgi:putative hydrolase of the HAD superfamily